MNITKRKNSLAVLFFLFFQHFFAGIHRLRESQNTFDGQITRTLFLIDTVFIVKFSHRGLLSLFNEKKQDKVYYADKII